MPKIIALKRSIKLNLGTTESKIRLWEVMPQTLDIFVLFKNSSYNYKVYSSSHKHLPGQNTQEHNTPSLIISALKQSKLPSNLGVLLPRDIVALDSHVLAISTAHLAIALFDIYSQQVLQIFSFQNPNKQIASLMRFGGTGCLVLIQQKRDAFDDPTVSEKSLELIRIKYDVKVAKPSIESSGDTAIKYQKSSEHASCSLVHVPFYSIVTPLSQAINSTVVVYPQNKHKQTRYEFSVLNIDDATQQKYYVLPADELARHLVQRIAIVEPGVFLVISSFAHKSWVTILQQDTPEGATSVLRKSEICQGMIIDLIDMDLTFQHIKLLKQIIHTEEMTSLVIFNYRKMEIVNEVALSSNIGFRYIDRSLILFQEVTAQERLQKQTEAITQKSQMILEGNSEVQAGQLFTNKHNIGKFQECRLVSKKMMYADLMHKSGITNKFGLGLDSHVIPLLYGQD